jgi:predicted ATPase
VSGQPTLVLVGPHGAGKTTLGHRLARQFRCAYDHEVGARLRREALARDPSQHAMIAQEAFDEAVFRSELGRDRRRTPGQLRVVETWHPGNVAYARERSPMVLSRWQPRLAEELRRWRPWVLVQPLRVRPETALARLTEPGPDRASLVAFFCHVGDEAVVTAASWGLAVLPALDTDHETPAALAAQVEAILRRWVPPAG